METVTYAMCEYCSEFIWHHISGRCLYSPFKFKESVVGYRLFIPGGGIYSVHYGFSEWLTQNKLPESHPYTTEIYWAHYLLEKGWKP